MNTLWHGPTWYVFVKFHFNHASSVWFKPENSCNFTKPSLWPTIAAYCQWIVLINPSYMATKQCVPWWKALQIPSCFLLNGLRSKVGVQVAIIIFYPNAYCVKERIWLVRSRHMSTITGQPSLATARQCSRINVAGQMYKIQLAYLRLQWKKSLVSSFLFYKRRQIKLDLTVKFTTFITHQ